MNKPHIVEMVRYFDPIERLKALEEMQSAAETHGETLLEQQRLANDALFQHRRSHALVTSEITYLRSQIHMHGMDLSDRLNAYDAEKAPPFKEAFEQVGITTQQAAQSLEELRRQIKDLTPPAPDPDTSTFGGKKRFK
jgi:hypothetical protein